MEFADAHEIVEGLYLGNYKVASNYPVLKRLNITCILNASIEHPNYFEGDLVYKKFPIYDHPKQNISQYFDDSFNFIENSLKNNKNILIHCHAGISRSSTLVAYYLMKKYVIDAETALNYIKNIRSFINPNIGFIKQLYHLR